MRLYYVYRWTPDVARAHILALGPEGESAPKKGVRQIPARGEVLARDLSQADAAFMYGQLKEKPGYEYGWTDQFDGTDRRLTVFDDERKQS